jgi:hypothetical protein
LRRQLATNDPAHYAADIFAKRQGLWLLLLLLLGVPFPCSTKPLLLDSLTQDRAQRWRYIAGLPLEAEAVEAAA